MKILYTSPNKEWIISKQENKFSEFFGVASCAVSKYKGDGNRNASNSWNVYWQGTFSQCLAYLYVNNIISQDEYKANIALL